MLLLQVPQNQSNWRKIMEDTLWNFPNCNGAMDGKLVNIKCPGNSIDYFYYKINAEICSVGTNGRANDASVFNKSTSNEALSLNLLNVPQEGVLWPMTPFFCVPIFRNHIVGTIGEFGDKQKMYSFVTTCTVPWQ